MVEGFFRAFSCLLPPPQELRKLRRKEIKALLYIDIAVVTLLDLLLKDP
jgi:hypothetical protein